MLIEKNVDNKKYDVLARRYPGKSIVRAAEAATQFTVSAEARTAARLPVIEAHVTYRVAAILLHCSLARLPCSSGNRGPEMVS